MNVLITVETLETGGAERFVVELATALSTEHSVSVYVVHPNRINCTYRKRLKEKVNLLYPNLVIFWLSSQLDRVMYKLRIDFSFLNSLSIWRLTKIISIFHFDVVHSNQFNVDYISSKAVSQFENVKHVTTIHGDYINFHKRFSANKPIYGNLNFEKKLSYILLRLDKVVCISENQMVFFRQFTTKGFNESVITKIYNGIALPAKTTFVENNDQFVFGMVARGIPEKGWEFAIKSFIRLGKKETRLVLVGGGAYLDDLKDKYSCSNIDFIGHVDDPFKYIASFDVGLLPSFYASESLPTTIIEYLALGKPTIATDIGEIEKMLQTDLGLAGVVLDKSKIEDELLIAMNKMYLDKQYHLHCSEIAKIGYLKFSIDACMRSYSKLYKSIVLSEIET